MPDTVPDTVPAILHVTGRAEWEAAQAAGVYAPPALARDGFLHLCTEEQLGFVLGRHFVGATGLLALVIDPGVTGARLDWVTSEPGQPPFPHLHGPIPLAAVRAVRAIG